MFDPQTIALATRCLWSLQEAATEIQGMLITTVDGLTVTSTLDGRAGMQRLAAVSTATFLLGEHMTETWHGAESLEVTLVIRDKRPESETDSLSRRDDQYVVCIKPVGAGALLTGIYHHTKRAHLIRTDLELAAAYLYALFNEAPVLPDLRWQSL